MRLFIAIDPPGNVKERIRSDFVYARDVLEFARFIEPDNLHITLAFLGEQNDNTVPRIKKAIETAARHGVPHPIAITGYRIGPDDSSPRMIWLKADKESEEFLKILSQRVRDGLVSGGINFDRTYHEFNNHITLARFSEQWQDKFSRSGSGKDGLIKEIYDACPSEINYEFYAGEITLFASEERSGARIYTPLFESKLGA